MEVKESNKRDANHFSDTEMAALCKECFSAESERIAENGEKFMEYFIRNASSDGVMFKTIKEITNDIEMPHQSLSKVLKVLEDRGVIYRRNGIIGKRKEKT